jgi:hypothetical protein
MRKPDGFNDAMVRLDAVAAGARPMRGDEDYINKYPNDAAEIAMLVRQADRATAIHLLKVWGSKQRDIGALKVLELMKERVDAQT